MCLSSGLRGRVLDCDSQFTILSPPSFDGPRSFVFIVRQRTLSLRSFILSFVLTLFIFKEISGIFF